MKVFISWSRPETKQFALFLAEWLQLVIQSVKPWMSERDVAKGTRSMAELGKELEGAQFGIVVLTAANQDSAWINFEAGAISKSTDDSKVVPLLLDLRKAEVVGPLSQFQAVDASSREDVFQLVSALNAALPEPLPENRLRRFFDNEWSSFQAQIVEFRRAAPEEPATRDERDVLDEILVLVRELRRDGEGQSVGQTHQTVNIEQGPVYLSLLGRHVPDDADGDVPLAEQEKE